MISRLTGIVVGFINFYPELLTGQHLHQVPDHQFPKVFSHLRRTKFSCRKGIFPRPGKNFPRHNSRMEATGMPGRSRHEWIHWPWKLIKLSDQDFWMKRIFGRIRLSLFNQSKIGKYLGYAFGEIILVVIGILIALQINNWNENRKSKQELDRIYLRSSTRSITMFRSWTNICPSLSGWSIPWPGF